MAENRERYWGEALKNFFLSPHTPVRRVRLTRFARVRLLRQALPISLRILRKKNRLFCSPGIIYPEKTADISPRHHWFPREMTSEQASGNPIRKTRHYLDVGSAFDWSKQISLAARQIRSTTQIWVATRHHYRVCARCFDAI